MPRAHRHFVPHVVWHITHRCHGKRFLLKFAQDRRRWLRWLFEAKKRYGLRVLNYIVTSNHVHLVVWDRGDGGISASMQLVAGRTAQAYNRRKGRRGAFWEDRYHATAVDTDAHLARCLVYLDLNMVRAGAVAHPSQWREGGYREIQAPPQRYGIVDLEALKALLGFDRMDRLQRSHKRWVEDRLAVGPVQREECWSEGLAVGRQSFVEHVRTRSGKQGCYHVISQHGDTYVLRECRPPYGDDCSAKMGPLSPENGVILANFCSKTMQYLGPTRMMFGKKTPA